MPAVFNAVAILHARAFYAADVLGLRGQMHAAFFEEIHVNGNPLDSVELLRALFGRFGVDAATFASTIDSAAVTAKVEQAQKLNSEYRISATPSIVVNRKYLTLAAMAGSYENWFAIIDELAAAERIDGDSQEACSEPPSRVVCPARR